VSWRPCGTTPTCAISGLAGTYPTLTPATLFVRAATDQHLLVPPLPHLLHPSSYLSPSCLTTKCSSLNCQWPLIAILFSFPVLVNFPQWIKSSLFLIRLLIFILLTVAMEYKFYITIGYNYRYLVLYLQLITRHAIYCSLLKCLVTHSR